MTQKALTGLEDEIVTHTKKWLILKKLLPKLKMKTKQIIKI